MNSEDKKIIGYNTQTGEPIYEQQNVLSSTNVIKNQIPNNIQTINNSINPNYIQSNNQLNQNQFYSQNSNNGKFNKKLLILPLLVIFIFIIILIFILSNNNNNSLSRTVMIYMVGSDLESQSGLATVDLETMNYNLMDNKNVNVLLIAGGSEKWDNNYIDVNETSIYELTANGFEKVKINSVQNMGSPDVLSNFLKYVYTNYKTDKYDLIFWNHGGAIYGSEFDELSEDNLSLSEMSQALSNSPFNKNNKLETVIFRTCLNGSIEIADVFVDYADYLVASEEVTHGFALQGILKFVNDIDITDDGYDVSYKFINSYKEMINNLNQTLYTLNMDESYIYSTYSIMDLSNVKQLEASVNEFFADIDVSQNYNNIARVRSNLYQYSSDELSFDMVDLYNLVDELKDLSPNKANKVLENINKTVLYNWATDSDSRGISIYFPYNGDNTYKNYFLSLYNSFEKLQPYNKFIKSFNSLQTSPYAAYSYVSNDTNIDLKNKEADFTLELTDEQKETFAKANYIVFRDDGDGYYLPIYRGKEVTLDGNTLTASIKDRQLKVVSNVDGSENIVTLIEDDNTDDYIKYTANVVLEDFSSEDIFEWTYDSAKMSLVYDKKNATTKIGSVILNSTNENTPGIVAVDLNDYTNVVFASSSYKILDDDGNYNEDWQSNGIIEGLEEKVGNFDFELKSFDDGYDYYCVFMIWNTNNNVSYSKLVKLD